MTSAQFGVSIEDLSEPERRLYELAHQPMPLAEVAVRLGVPIGDADRRIAALLVRLDLPDRVALQGGGLSRVPPPAMQESDNGTANSSRPRRVGTGLNWLATVGWLALTVGLATAAAYVSWA